MVSINGKKILVNGIPYLVFKSEHLKVARGIGMIKTTLKNLLDGSIINKTFKDSDKIENIEINLIDTEFLYFDTNSYYFMNLKNYEQIIIDTKKIGNNKYFLVEGSKVKLQEFNGNIIDIQIEPTVVLKIIDTTLGNKNDVIAGGKKLATLETGLTIFVPPFLKVGDKIKINTETLNYLGRI